MTNYKKNIDRKSQFINAISNCLYQVKAYNLHNVCSSQYGLKEGDTGDINESYHSKKTYITSRIQHKNLADLISLGKKILESYYGIELENLILLEEESDQPKITELTLLNLISYLAKISLCGRIDKENFLSKMIALNIASDDILQNSAWEEEDWLDYHYQANWITIYSNSNFIKKVLKLSELPQSKLFSFIELLVSPEVRAVADAEELVENINKIISHDGFFLQKVSTKQNHPVFKITHKSSSKIIDPQSLKNLHNTKEISSKYIEKYIQDCKKYIDIKEYEKAIAHARVLVEEVFIEILKQSNVDYDDTKGDLVKLFKKITKNTNLNKEIITEKLKNKELQDSFLQIVSSLAGIVTATAHISNNMSARHGGIKEKPSERHATLTVNCAYTVCNFIFDSYKNSKKFETN